MNQYKLTVLKYNSQKGENEVCSILTNVGKKWFENFGSKIIEASLPFYVTNAGEVDDPDEIVNNYAWLYISASYGGLIVEMNGTEWTSEQKKLVHMPLYQKGSPNYIDTQDTNS